MARLKQTELQPIDTGFANIDKLFNSGVISRAGLAAKMFPANNNPGQYLYKKLHKLQRQSFTTVDRKKVENIFADLFASNK